MVNTTAQSAIIALFVQSIMYGLYLASTTRVLRWLLYDDEGWRLRPLRKEPRFLMLVITSLLFLLSTVDLVTSVILTIDPESETKSYYDVNTINVAAENGTALITDGVLIYRCWIVYAKSWRVALLPTLLWITNLAFCIMITVYEASQSTAKPLGSIFLHIWVYFYTFTLAINIYATSAIIYRILRVAGKSSNRTISGRLYKTGRNIAESGFLYTLTSILILVMSVVYVDPNSLGYSIADALHFSITGITFNLILIRSHERVPSQEEEYISKHGMGTQEQFSTVQSNMNTNETNQAVLISVVPEERNQEEIQEVERS